MSNFKCEKCGTICCDTPKPEFRREVLKEVIEHILSDDILVAKKMLDQVVDSRNSYNELVEELKEKFNLSDWSARQIVAVVCNRCGCERF